MTKNFLLIIIITLLVCAGTILTFIPVMKENQALEKQNDLMVAIENGVSEISIELLEDDTELDYYGNSGSSSDADTSIDEEISLVSGIGIIEIESIDLRLPVVEGVEGSKLKIAPGHVSESAGIGEVGNCIIAGHRKYEYGQMFNRLDEVSVGDMILFTSVDGTEYTYQVYGITVIEPGDMSLFDFDDGQKKLTLLTCTPIRKATHRLLIMANLEYLVARP